MGNGDLKYGLEVDPSGGLAGLRAFAKRAEKDFGDLALPLMGALGGAGALMGNQLADGLGIDNPAVAGAMSAAGTAMGALMGASLAGSVAAVVGQGGAASRLKAAMTGLFAVSGLSGAATWARNLAGTMRTSIAAAMVPMRADMGRAGWQVADEFGRMFAGRSTAGFRRALANNLVAISMWSDLAVQRLRSVGGKLGAAMAPLATYGMPVLHGLGTAFSALATIAVAAASAVAAAVLGMGAVIVAFAAKANRAWSQVEDGVMRVQAALVGQGSTMAAAFSDKVADKIMEAARNIALALGIPAEQTAGALAELVKNGMSLEQAMGQMNLVANIATVNQLSMAEAAGKLTAAWNGEERVLKDLGIRFKATGNEAEDAAIAMKLLKERYGGGLTKPFIDDNPFKRASAAVNMLWAELGRAFDPSMTALAEKLSDVVIGIVEGLRLGSGEMTAMVEGAMTMIWDFLTKLVDAAAFVGNVFQLVAAIVTGVLATVWQALMTMGNWAKNGIMWAVSFIKEQLGKIIATLGEGLSYIPGLGDKGTGIQRMGEEMRDSGQADQDRRGRQMSASGRDTADTWNAAADTINKELVDIGGIVVRQAEGGSILDDLMAKGRAAREEAAGKLAGQGSPALGDSDKVRSDREIRERKAAEEAGKAAEKAAEERRFAQGLQADRNRSVNGALGGYTAARNRMTIVLQTPQRMVPALRHGGARGGRR